MPLKIVHLMPDNRDERRAYGQPTADFHPAHWALVKGLAESGEAEVHIISCTQQPMPTRGELAPNLYHHQLVVPKIGWLRTGYQGCIRAIRSKLREIRPDMVHAQGTERYCALAALYSGYPNVLTVHGNMRTIAQVFEARPFSFHWCAARLEGFVLRRVAGVVCITNYTKALVAPPARKAWVVPNAAEEAFFQTERGGRNPPEILCIGFVDKRKNQNFLIKALDDLAGRFKFKLKFYGGVHRGDAYGSEFLRLVGERPEWCEYIGQASRAELPQILAGAAILALPSLEDNCPMVVLEAMAAGVPVVAANVGGVPDLVIPGETGFLDGPSDPAAFARDIEALLVDPNLGMRMGKAGKQFALQHFAPEVIAQAHLKIYREQLAILGRTGK